MEKRCLFARFCALVLALMILFSWSVASAAVVKGNFVDYGNNSANYKVQYFVAIGDSNLDAIKQSLTEVVDPDEKVLKYNLDVENLSNDGKVRNTWATGISSVSHGGPLFTNPHVPSHSEDDEKVTAAFVWMGESCYSPGSGNFSRISGWGDYFDHGYEGDLYENYELSALGDAGGSLVDGNGVERWQNNNAGYTTTVVGHQECSDSSAGLTDGQISGMAVGRAVCGYSYIAVRSVPVVPEAYAQKPVMVDDPEGTIDPVTGAVMQVQAVGDDGLGITEDDKSRPLYKDELYSVQVTGACESWFSSRYGKVYLVSLAPASRDLDDDDRQKRNENVILFNSGLSSTCGGRGKYLDIFNYMMDDNLYFSDKSSYHVNNSPPWYAENTLRTIYYLIWSSILADNKNDPLPEAVSSSMYDVAASLTSYANWVVSAAAIQETKSRMGEDLSGYNDHELKEASDIGFVNAGSFVGYGDTKPPYSFHSGYIQSLSRTSSSTSYNALYLASHNFAKDNSNAMYVYARYGRLLNDLGFDKTGTATAGVSNRYFPGGFLLLLYVFSSIVPLLFDVVLYILKVLNPFTLFSICGEYVKSPTNTAIFTGAYSWLKTPVGLRIADFFGGLYNGLQDIGVGFVVPMMLVFGVAWFLIVSPRTRVKETKNKLMKSVIRVVFIVVGIPLLGAMYTDCINSIGSSGLVSEFASTEITASSFVDFSAWVKGSRLEPTSGMSLVSVPLSDGGGGDNVSGGAVISGEASGITYRNARKYAMLINKNFANISVYGKAAADWNTEGGDLSDLTYDWWSGAIEGTSTLSSDIEAVSETLGLVRSYMDSAFYGSSTWESESSSFTSKVLKTIDRTLLGRRYDPDEKKPPDMTGTLYNFYDVTNEFKDWKERPQEENVALFHNAETEKNDFTGFRLYNMINNGGSSFRASGSAIDGVITYTGSSGTTSDPKSEEHAGYDGSAFSFTNKIGFSSLSMYNYLSSVFSPSEIKIYSSLMSASETTMPMHYAVNMIGDGGMFYAFYFSLFAVLFVMSVVGFVYAFGILVSNFKNMFKLLAQLPMAVVGVGKSIMNVVSTVAIMCIETVFSIALFSVISDFILMIANMVEYLFADDITSGLTSTIVGGLLSAIGVSTSSVDFVNSRFVFGFGMVLVALLSFGVDYWLIKVAPMFFRVRSKVYDLVLLKLGIDVDLTDVDTERTFVNKPVPVFNMINRAFDGFVELVSI